MKTRIRIALAALLALAGLTAAFLREQCIDHCVADGSPTVAEWSALSPTTCGCVLEHAP